MPETNLATIPTLGGSAVEITSHSAHFAPLTATCRGCTSQRQFGSFLDKPSQYIDEARRWAQDHALNCWAAKRR